MFTRREHHCPAVINSKYLSYLNACLNTLYVHVPYPLLIQLRGHLTRYGIMEEVRVSGTDSAPYYVAFIAQEYLNMPGSAKDLMEEVAGYMRSIFAVFKTRREYSPSDLELAQRVVIFFHIHAEYTKDLTELSFVDSTKVADEEEDKRGHFILCLMHTSVPPETRRQLETLTLGVIELQFDTPGRITCWGDDDLTLDLDTLPRVTMLY